MGRQQKTFLFLVRKIQQNEISVIANMYRGLLQSLTSTGEKMQEKENEMKKERERERDREEENMEARKRERVRGRVREREKE